MSDQCLAILHREEITDICRKTKGHTEAADARHRLHFDPDHEILWGDGETLTEALRGLIEP